MRARERKVKSPDNYVRRLQALIKTEHQNMFTPTPKQIEAEKTLEKQGFRFSNWISAQTENEDEGCMIMKRKPKSFITEYREIDPDGNIN